MEVSTGHAICAWDDTVPAEEEALGLKLAIEHREGWLLGFGTMDAAGPVGYNGPALYGHKFAKVAQA